MPRKERNVLMGEIEKLRDGRRLICLLDFDRSSQPQTPGLQRQYGSDMKEPLFRVLKEMVDVGKGIDVFSSTRGGDTDAVWPIVSLLREFDEQFEVLVPFRCHSSGTLMALGSAAIHMGPLSELSPIDPTTGNQFNPPDPSSENPRARLGISVEDVTAYQDFISQQFGGEEVSNEMMLPFVTKLVEEVHPLALGNVHRVYQQIKALGKNLLDLNFEDTGEAQDKIVSDLASRFYSHVHMINRHEAKEILGDQRIKFADTELSAAMDALYVQYKKDYDLWKPYFLADKMGNDQNKEFRFVGGVVESATWSYLFDTKLNISQGSVIPANVQVQIPPGQPMPIVPGLPKQYRFDIISQGWTRNEEPKGIDK